MALNEADEKVVQEVLAYAHGDERRIIAGLCAHLAHVRDKARRVHLWCTIPQVCRRRLQRARTANERQRFTITEAMRKEAAERDLHDRFTLGQDY